ncbi:MAG: enoyl-CoA hydratase/isomerase family protein, partial [Chloroflexota bacterium]
MAYKTLLLEKKGKITVLTFNRPARLNAVNATMNVEIPRAIQEVAADDACRVLVLTGSGRGFCAGGDFRGDEDSLIGSETVQTANRT